MDKKLEKIIEQYRDVPIPKELDFIVKKTIKQRKKGIFKHEWLVGTGAAAIAFVIGINASPAFAYALSEVPLVGKLVQVLTFREYKIDDGNFTARIEVPALKNLENKSLEHSLNQKYLEESKKLYSDFKKEMESVKQSGGGHLGVDSRYVVKTDNDRILSIGRSYVNTVGSSSTTIKYDTIDKKNQVLITLPSLFIDDRYIKLISDNIKEQMIKQVKDDPDKFYWVAGVPNTVNSYFENISKDQNFYINNDGKLVISFDKYEVAPGFMGVVEFIIPTNVLTDVLVSQEYIK
ncbi:RsiV family protein [Paenibacillus alvei]|uniref:RsiV family protein n=1 Tax=Paenibacillus alvei TaxID=44250 RepID=A0ABT4GU27_PAEAL|nr:RsiV family protein [Paenibacillus alvei]MCY7487509.1 RsiV family protein [Paenibacillus alvei]MCY9542887.1 RsiV family protein [Paenibacillus alvei]MCY9706935.1 RsiV family protein [Paenibacillus alvei]MCY9735138.1 RsiV family protein [Paenibacillus alvei]MCY9753342.1 RsiV family protein [Paenibacillus alvei]